MPARDVRALAQAALSLAARSASPAFRDRVRAAASARHSLARRHREVERVLTVAAHSRVAEVDSLIAGAEAVGA